MPTSARKSSIVPRRGQQKYIPYRADDYEHGKRTGIAVGYIDHDSDGFEPFEQVMGQADLRTPPKPKVQAKKRRSVKKPVVEEIDEDGEMSMELVDSGYLTSASGVTYEQFLLSTGMPNSPATYFAHARIPSITSSVQRIGSSSRPVPRQSDVDFDKIPSPRNGSSAFSRRSSTINGISAGPSHLSHSLANMDDDSSDGGFNEPFDGGYDDPGLPPSDPESDPEATPVPQRRKSIDVRRASFAQIGQDEEDDPEGQDEQMQEEEEVERHMNGKQAKGKGKGKSKRVVEEEEELPMEDDIAQGLEEVENQPEEYSGPEEQEEPEPPRGKAKGRKREDDSTENRRSKKKARAENPEEHERPKKPRGRPRKENVLREGIVI